MRYIWYFLITIFVSAVLSVLFTGDYHLSDTQIVACLIIAVGVDIKQALKEKG